MVIAVGYERPCSYLVRFLGQASIDKKGKRAAGSRLKYHLCPLRHAGGLFFKGAVVVCLQIFLGRQFFAPFRANLRLCANIRFHSRTRCVLMCLLWNREPELPGETTRMAVTHTEVTSTAAPLFLPS